MDELGKIINELLQSAPQPEGESAAPQESAPAATPPDLSGLLGALSAPAPAKNRKLQLLTALAPYLRTERREKLSQVQALLGTAYTVRGLLSSLGGILHV